jgi:steroid Delta-isomerase
MVDRTAIDKTLDAYLAAFTAGDRTAWLGCFASDAWIEDPVGSPRVEGIDAIGGFWDSHHGAVEHIELRALGLRVIIGNECAHTIQARPKLGDEVFSVDIVSVMTFDEDARITTMRAFFDPASMGPATDD